MRKNIKEKIIPQVPFHKMDVVNRNLAKSMITDMQERREPE
jgi:hypothetical protein